MELQRTDLQKAVTEGILTAESAEALWHFLQSEPPDRPTFQGSHILYYLGGLLAIGALSLFMTQGWVLLGGWGLAALALLFGLLTTWLSHWFLQRKQLLIPAGIMLTLSVVLVPLAIYGLQMGLGYWEDVLPYQAYHTKIDGRWLVMEWGTLLVAALLLWRMPMPFAVMPVAVTLWYMSMDLLPLLLGTPGWQGVTAQNISILFGLGMLLLAFAIDVRQKGGLDYAFWLYQFGMLTFWGGLSFRSSDAEWAKFFYFCINIGLIVLGGLLRRRVFALFGGLGMAGYLGYLSHKWFSDSLLFPFVLIVIGFALLYLGVWWQRQGQALTERYRGHLPQMIVRLWER
ncbi:DUF2157 domain-containing protein [Candidatus Magnetaquicoccus inordinatus]|uniref:DUF2157 domain-containing protein n=1 Tax=Candidatus Magnetaquicoccus inordinatus TaxID=2496818 RepID=UPI00102B87D1|nr:DUF2157 domain-containing protein [Candidatus Magnetaquicoccus inordinatus]